MSSQAESFFDRRFKIIFADMLQETLLKSPRLSLLRRLLGRSFWAFNEWAWECLSPSLLNLSPVQCYGRFLHALIRVRAIRTQSFGTFFLRNRAELELMRQVADRKEKDATLALTVLACSKGAEVYSIMWTIRKARPDLKITAHAIDISPEILEFAQNGVYSLTNPDRCGTANPGSPSTGYVLVHDTNRDQNHSIFERLTGDEMAQIFDREDDRVRVKEWIKEGIRWRRGDAGDLRLADAVGPQDIVVANRFLCHMDPADAERCLRNIGRLVAPRGHLFVSGIDLDVRTRVVKELGWKPVGDGIEDIHDGDRSLRMGWPWQYWGLEPLNKKRPDWKIRYASVFQLA